MSDTSYRTWPWFDDRHRQFADRLEAWAAVELPVLLGDHKDVDAICRRLVAALGDAGWLDVAVPKDGEGFDLRAICLAREVLARHAALADFAFAMQGLGTGAITLFGTAAQRQRWLPGPRGGRHLTGFALSEPEAGSDVAAMQMTAREDAGGFRLDGVKTWISNGGIADQYVVFAKDGPKYTAFVLAADTPGLTVAERIDVVAPHPLATLRFENCVVPPEAVIGERGAGMRVDGDQAWAALQPDNGSRRPSRPVGRRSRESIRGKLGEPQRDNAFHRSTPAASLVFRWQRGRRNGFF